MKAVLHRDKYTEGETLGIFELFDDQGALIFSCYTLEDEVRPEGVKIKTKTAIPEGKYLLDVNFSNRFGKLMPIVYNNADDLSVTDLKGARWTGIRIHSGNVAADTDGCILVGAERYSNKVINSRVTFDKLMPLLNNTKRPIPFEIINDPFIA